MGAPNAGRTFFCTAKFPTPFTLRHIPHKLHTFPQTTICPSPLSPHTARAFVVRLHPFPVPRTQPYVISIFHSPPKTVPGCESSRFSRQTCHCPSSNAQPLFSRRIRERLKPCLCQDTINQDTSCKRKWKERRLEDCHPPESRTSLCGIPRSTLRRVLEYLPQSTRILAAKHCAMLLKAESGSTHPVPRHAAECGKKEE